MSEYGVLIRAWGPHDEPGEARYREYIEDADGEEAAKEAAIETAKTSFTRGIIESGDSYEVVEVEHYG